MWVLLSARLRRWLLVTAVLPLVAMVARSAADRVERSRGPNPVTGALRRVGSLDRRGGRRGSRRGR
jgi:hypothetical protein